MTRARELTPQPGMCERVAAVARFPVGLAVSTLRYVWWSSDCRRNEGSGDASDLPPRLPLELLDEHVKTLDDGSGPLFHRIFRIRLRGSRLGPEAVMDEITRDLDRTAPSEVVSFRKHRGRLGALRVGDEYRVRMPAPWDGPVRAVHRGPTSFRFTTLAGHLEAGQVEFRAVESDGGLAFEIETWSRAGDRVADVVFDRLRIGKEIQLHMWTQFCLAVAGLAGGRREGPITADTRRVAWSDDLAGADLPM
jgi:hypothetical protein